MMRPSLVVRTYFSTWRLLNGFFRFTNAIFVGFWLGVLDRDDLHSIDQIYYDREPMYTDDDYNSRGLFGWEQEVVGDYFAGCQRLLLIGAGGGRESLALTRLGHTVDSFECNPVLVDYANRFLARQGSQACVQEMRRDELPTGLPQYDGLVLGWGAFMLIQGRTQRQAFLQQLRGRVPAGAPLLLSFYDRPGVSRRVRLLSAVANALRAMQGKEPLDLGDDLVPNFVHSFTAEQLAEELQAGGFHLSHYSNRSYGHAIALAAG